MKERSREGNPSHSIDCVYFLQSTHVGSSPEINTEIILSHCFHNLLLGRKERRDVGREGVSEGGREGGREGGKK